MDMLICKFSVEYNAFNKLNIDINKVMSSIHNYLMAKYGIT